MPQCHIRRTPALTLGFAILTTLCVSGEAIGQDAPPSSSTPPDLRPYAPGTPQLGIGGRPERPATAVLRQDEDWSFLADVAPDERRPLDGLKYVPLSPDGSIFATFGFDGTIGFEHFDEESFGDNPGGDTTLHLRANPHLGLTFGDRFRLYGALKFGESDGSQFLDPPADDDGPDLHQAFAELSFGDAFGLDPQDALLRVGRQELHYGAGRLISIRNGPNVRFDYDGVLARARIGPVIGDVFAFRPTVDDPGSFNNETDDTQAIWGLYTTTALGDVFRNAGPFIGRSNLDLFYVGLDREVSPYAFQAPPLDETRHTIGARLWMGGPPTDGLNVEIEAGYQFGRADGILTAGGPIEADISAGYVAGGLSYGFADLPWTPVIGSRFGISSGDDDPTSGTLTTFRAPFPPGRFFGESNPLGPGNIAGLGPSLSVYPREGLVITGRYEAFWRLADEDGVYAPPQVPLRGTAGGDAFVGQEFSLIVDYAINDYLSLNVTGALFDAGAFLSDNLPDEDIGYVQAKLFVKF